MRHDVARHRARRYARVQILLWEEASLYESAAVHARRTLDCFMYSLCCCFTALYLVKPIYWFIVFMLSLLRSRPLRPSAQGAQKIVYSCEIDTRCAVLQFRILLDRKSKRANESLRGYPSFRSEVCENIVWSEGPGSCLLVCVVCLMYVTCISCWLVWLYRLSVVSWCYMLQCCMCVCYEGPGSKMYMYNVYIYIHMNVCVYIYIYIYVVTFIDILISLFIGFRGPRKWWWRPCLPRCTRAVSSSRMVSACAYWSYYVMSYCIMSCDTGLD